MKLGTYTAVPNISNIFEVKTKKQKGNDDIKEGQGMVGKK
jgi:hypothetical protein